MEPSEAVKVPKLRCVRCDCTFEDAMPGSEPSPPSGGLVFTSGGNYGSGVFDETGDSRLLVLICDECILALRALENVVIYRQPVPSAVKYTLWKTGNTGGDDTAGD